MTGMRAILTPSIETPSGKRSWQTCDDGLRRHTVLLVSKCLAAIDRMRGLSLQLQGLLPSSRVGCPLNSHFKRVLPSAFRILRAGRGEARGVHKLAQVADCAGDSRIVIKTSKKRFSMVPLNTAGDASATPSLHRRVFLLDHVHTTITMSLVSNTLFTRQRAKNSHLAKITRARSEEPLARRSALESNTITGDQYARRPPAAGGSGRLYELPLPTKSPRLYVLRSQRTRSGSGSFFETIQPVTWSGVGSKNQM
ncbi:hypothetical protein EVAR_13740_1 [Eumeta japonica]|uniref:Uncharacterized protein n=1 Tax=Eumeta variegata TaxID=151549 RepID=A0A4C1UBE2_EUMVA|nr:hypothetical protein EVAR_13740_1 [Eumeta japonica]